MAMPEQDDLKGPTLMSCPVCSGVVSSDAIACPHCGHPMRGNVTKAICENMAPIKDSIGRAAKEVKHTIDEGLDNRGRTYRGYVVTGVFNIIYTWATVFGLVILFGAFGWPTGGSFALLFGAFATYRFMPTRERYDHIIAVKKREKEFADNFHLDVKTVRCPDCESELRVDTMVCPKCKYEIGKKIKEGRNAAKARGEVDPPDEVLPKVEIPSPPLSGKTVFIILAVIFVGLILFGFVRHMIR